jgi:DNA modification methylase
MTGSTPTPHYQTEHVTLYHGDCSDILAQLPDNSVDSIVTDPPYGIEFMGKQWDAFAPEVAASTAARTGSKTKRNDGGMHEHSVLSGGPLPVFGGNRSRTFVCVLCGKRDQFRNPHACDDQPGARWESVVINEHGAPAAAIGFQQWCEQWARECLRVLKPGGHLLAFGGARTYHRLACAIEDAGFDIRDSIHWVYGSGFPKSLNISKQLDKAAGVEREVVGHSKGVRVSSDDNQFGGINRGAVGIKQIGVEIPVTAPATDLAKQWEGWGTALKPAHEPIVLARKPPRDTITRNVTRYGTGALNIDATRIPHDPAVNLDAQQRQQHADGAVDGAFGAAALIGREIPTYKPEGRWPANVIHDGSSEVLEHFPTTTGNDDGNAGRFFNATPYTELDGASFVYCPKAGTRERNAGLDHLDTEQRLTMSGGEWRDDEGVVKNRPKASANIHPTVKPLALMRHLIRLITPPGGTVLEPFAGSGTTLAAATLEGFHAIGIELTADYLPIITGRIQWAAEQHANENPTLF